MHSSACTTAPRHLCAPLSARLSCVPASHLCAPVPPCLCASASLRLSASAARSLGLSVSLASPRGRDAHGAKFELLTNASQPLSLPSSRSPSMLLQSLLACCCWLCVTGCALASGALVARGLSSCLPAPVSASRLGGWSGGIQEHEEPGPREKSPAPESVGPWGVFHGRPVLVRTRVRSYLAGNQISTTFASHR